jgi:putative endonuclease
MSHLKTGAEGEKLAAEYLQKKGYKVLDINWKYERCEIDIIAEKKGLIVFVEVKTRSGANYGWPEEAVNPAKQKNIAKAADAYLEEKNLDKEIRFDIISVIFRPSKTDIYHIEDAFIP